MNLLQKFAVPSVHKKGTIIPLQWAVAIGTSYLSLFYKGEPVEDLWVFSLLVLLLGSILVLQYLPQSAINHKFFPHVLVVVDTILISGGIALNRESPWELFLIFFFGLFIATLGQGMIRTVMGCLIISILPVFMKSPSQIDSDLLLRIPFLFGAFVLYGNLAEQIKREKRKVEELQAALHDIDKAITSTLDLDTVLDVLLEKIDLFLPYSAVTVRLWNKESGLLEPATCRNLDEGEWKVTRWRAGRGPANVVFESKAPWMASNVQADPRIRDLEFFRKHGLISYLGVPLIAKGEALGVLSFYTKEEHHFSDEEVGFLSTLADQAAIALQNSRLYEQTKDQAVELERSNKVKDQFLSVMSHELRTPLSVIMGYTGMIQEKLLGGMNPEQEEVLQKVMGRSKELFDMITAIFYAISLETKAVKVESHEARLGDFLDKLRSAYDGPLDKELTLNWDYPSDLPVVKTDSDKLRLILQNLINNAIKFTEKGNLTVSARYFPETNVVEFKTVDSGIGIPKESLPIIFEKFRQVDSSETRLYGGVGMGLYIVKKFTELLGGTVEVESEPGKGSTFTVAIPFERSER